MHKLALVVIFFAMMVSPMAWASGPATTTIADTLVNPDGSRATGTITVVNPQTFTSADGYPVPKGTVATSTITNGIVTVALVPNAGASPSGTSYQVTFRLAYSYFTETWVVPSSGTPVSLASVRALSPPTRGVTVSFNQLAPPADCTNLFPEWTGSGWTCSSFSGGGMANPMAATGDLIYGGASGAPARLAGNTTVGKLFLSQAGTGTASAAPTWTAITSADLPATISSNTTGNATTATALAATPAQCTGNQFATGITAAGAANCAAPPQGTVTSVGLGLPSIFSVSGSPVTGAGMLSASLTVQSANLIFAGPSSGTATVPTFRALVAADLPSSITSSTSGNAATATALAVTPGQCAGGQYATGIAASGSANCAQVGYIQLSGTPTLQYQTVQSGGTAVTQRSVLNFGAGLSCADDAVNGRTDCSNAGVTSFNGRAGAVSPAANDYSFSQINGAASASQLPVMVGDSGSGGSAGIVPAPAAGDAAAGKFLKANGTWATPAGGASSPRLYTQTTVAAGDTVTDSCTGTGCDFASGTYTFSAGSFCPSVGTVYHIITAGLLTTVASTGAGNAGEDLYVGGNWIAAAQIYESAGNTDLPWQNDAWITCTATGANGALEVTWIGAVETGTSANQGDADVMNPAHTATIPVNTTGSVEIESRAHFNTSAGNTVTQRDMIVLAF